MERNLRLFGAFIVVVSLLGMCVVDYRISIFMLLFGWGTNLENRYRDE